MKRQYCFKGESTLEASHVCAWKRKMTIDARVIRCENSKWLPTSNIHSMHVLNQLQGALEEKIAGYHQSKGNVCVAYHGTRCHSTCEFFIKEEVQWFSVAHRFIHLFFKD